MYGKLCCLLRDFLGVCIFGVLMHFLFINSSKGVYDYGGLPLINSKYSKKKK
jgi:hypothetical protein